MLELSEIVWVRMGSNATWIQRTLSNGIACERREEEDGEDVQVEHASCRDLSGILRIYTRVPLEGYMP